MPRGPSAAGLRFWHLDSPFGRLTVVAGARGVRRISLPGDDLTDVGDARPGRDRAISAALDAWFAGRREQIDVDVDLDGVDGFRRAVLETLRAEVGWGETVTYGELAEMAGRPRAARAAGSALRANPVPFVIPCHRVIAAGGRIGGYGGGRAAIELKRRLLEREGVRL
jgi:methylated-DNA-[protein]-cysteine S-methyltransferase